MCTSPALAPLPSQRVWSTKGSPFDYFRPLARLESTKRESVACAENFAPWGDIVTA
jgi:hypothetical protein